MTTILDNVYEQETTDKRGLWTVIVLFAVVGVVFGLLFAQLASNWYVQQDASDFSVIAYIAILLLTIVFFGAIGLVLGTAYQKHQLRQQVDSTTTTTTTHSESA